MIGQSTGFWITAWLQISQNQGSVAESAKQNASMHMPKIISLTGLDFMLVSIEIVTAQRTGLINSGDQHYLSLRIRIFCPIKKGEGSNGSSCCHHSLD
jgi:hypothetical protein